jgi:TIR domain
MSEAGRNHVFISYSHQDKEWFDLLLKMLSPLERNQTIEVWWDGRITPGQEWLAEIREALNSARIAVLLVSPDFLASQFILNEELPTILDRAKSGGVILFWCLVKNCLWRETPLVGYQAAHNPTKVWNRLSQGDLFALLEEVGNKIKEAFEQSAAPLPPPREVPIPLPARPAVSTVMEPRVSPEAEPEVRRRQSLAETDGSLWRKAAGILAGVDDLAVIEEVGCHFVIQKDWPDALFAFDRMVEIATPGKPSGMARGYEYLGYVYRARGEWQQAGECWKIGRNVYRRIGKQEEAAALAKMVHEINAQIASSTAI